MVYISHLVTWHVACVGLSLVQHRVDFAKSNLANYLLQRGRHVEHFFDRPHLQCPTREEKCRLPFCSWVQSYTGKSCMSSFSFSCDICRIMVCWDPEILLPWQRHVRTSPVYYQDIAIYLFKNKTFEIPEYDCADRLLFTQHLSYKRNSVGFKL